MKGVKILVALKNNLMSICNKQVRRRASRIAPVQTLQVALEKRVGYV